MRFHVEAAYGQVKTPTCIASPSQPVVRGPAMATGATFQFYVPITNPLRRRVCAARRERRRRPGFTPVTYRVLGHGGNQRSAATACRTRSTTSSGASPPSLDGKLGDWAGIAKDVGYDFAVTYNQAINFNTHPDIIGYRFQEALNGFGGPSCNAVDLDPARFGTQNAAAAGRERLPVVEPLRDLVRQTAGPQPRQPAICGGHRELDRPDAAGCSTPRGSRRSHSSLTVDLVFNGKTGLQLPGGEVGWALGGQGRQFESRENGRRARS